MNNSGTLLQILLGSREKLDKDNQKLISDKIQNTATKLGNDFRKIVEDSLPVFYLVNIEIIVNEMLKEIHPSNPQEYVAKYLNSLTVSRNDEDDLSRIYEQNVFFSELSEFLPEYTVVYRRILRDKHIIISKVLEALSSKISNSTAIAVIGTEIDMLSAEVVQALKGVAVDIADTTAENKLRVIGAKLTQAFKSIGVSKISDPRNIISNFDASKNLFIVLPSFSSIRENVHNVITQSLTNQLEQFSIQVNLASGKFLAGNFAAAGHTGLKDASGKVVGINTPLTQLASLILASSNADAPGLLDSFAVNTGHSSWNLTVNADYADPNKLGLSLGISYLQSMPSVINSGSLSTSELANISTALKAKLNKSYKELANEFKSKIVSNFGFIFKSLHLSPTLKETVGGYIAAAITGETYAGSNSKGNSSKIGVDNIVKVSGKNKKPTRGLGDKSKVSPSAIPITASAKPVSLVSLQSLINNLLAKTIKENMGTGSRRDILNLRTGRFAESVKVERMSQSREGMITAFYSYMQNPYGTFSEGGRQQYPRTRDPKLLIAKSIREIAETQVKNRLRAVLV